MSVTFDDLKRLRTLRERGLDFADAAVVFAGRVLTLLDDRMDYGEDRFQTCGELRGRFVMIVRTWRRGTRRVISMRHCHEWEVDQIKGRLGRSG